MNKRTNLIGVLMVILGLGSLSHAGEGHKMGGPGKGAIESMSKEKQIAIALSAAPPEIAKDAAVMVYDGEGKLVEAKKGTNGFVCYPDISKLSDPDPICNDPAADRWFNDLLSGKPKPTNSVPGISYMARGGWHFEKDGRIVMEDGPGVKKVQEPPHWMIFWPFDGKTTGIPDLPGRLGTYIMFDGTPYAHLMIYQHPKGIR